MKSLIYSMVMVNGFSMMSFEMLASKMISPYFGHSMAVWGAIISIFMLALAIGAVLGGRLSRRHSKINILAGLFLVLTITSAFFSSSYDFTLGSIEALSFATNTKLLVSLVLLFTPFTIVSGMVTPYSIQILANTGMRSGDAAGFLYFLSTIACALGTILTSFYLVIWFSVDVILTLNVTLLLSFTCISFFLSLPDMSVNGQHG